MSERFAYDPERGIVPAYSDGALLKCTCGAGWGAGTYHDEGCPADDSARPEQGKHLPECTCPREVGLRVTWPRNLPHRAECPLARPEQGDQ